MTILSTFSFSIKQLLISVKIEFIGLSTSLEFSDDLHEMSGMICFFSSPLVSDIGLRGLLLGRLKLYLVAPGSRAVPKTCGTHVVLRLFASCAAV